MARIGQKSSRWVNPVLPSAGSSSSGPPAMQQNATKCNTFSLPALFPASNPQPMQDVRPQALHRPIQESPLSRRPRRTCLRTSPNFQRTLGPHPNVLRRSGRKLFPAQIVIHTFGSMSSGRNDFFPRAPRPGPARSPQVLFPSDVAAPGRKQRIPLRLWLCSCSRRPADCPAQSACSG